ncbi:MAG: ATP-binding cassette domain-containing protein [Lachnospira sp.]
MYIELKNVTKKIKGVTVLDNISLRMESGNIYGLKGKNGSGKTMLMRAISGLIKVSGVVDINGTVLDKKNRFPQSIGILIENPAFIRNYTGFDNLKTLASIKGIISDEKIRNTLTEVGLDPDDTRTFRKYSLGMKQRLGIAAAIMEDPDIIILDEPINALDESGVEQVRGLLAEHKKRGAIIIVACHDAEELYQLSDEIIEIAEGKIKNDDEVKEQ